MIRRPHSTTRSAFTLVELLMVIMIIGLLISILLPAVYKVRNSARRAQCGADIAQLSTAAASFKQEYKFYPPDNYTIPVKTSDSGFLILKQMYPRWNPAVQADGVTITPALTNAGQTLIGIKSLFYFITGPSNSGWAVDAPVEPSASALSRKGPFFEYSGLPPANYLYLDPWATPYAYFASGPGGKYSSAAFSYANPEGLTTTVSPYFSPGSTTKFVNSDSIQIISAGANGPKSDGGFGPGGTSWTPNSGAYIDSFKPASGVGSGYDDMANFYSGKQLGAE